MGVVRSLHKGACVVCCFLDVWCCGFFKVESHLRRLPSSSCPVLPSPLLGTVTTASISSLTSSAELVRSLGSHPFVIIFAPHQSSTPFWLGISGLRIFSYF